MTENTKTFLIRLFGIVIAILVVLFAVALYQGKITVADETQTQIAGYVVAIIGAVATGVITYINVRSNAAVLKQNELAAELARLNSNRNAAATQEKVQTLITDVHDGLKGDFARATEELVSKQAEVVAAELKKVGTDPTLQAIEEHTADIAENTAKEPE
jgi:hypothetical protein